MKPKNNFSFDEVNHIYRLDGRIIPSVTGILQAEGITDYSYADESDREFGRAGHKMTELWDKGTLDIKTISAPLIPYLNGYKKFLKDFKVKFKTNEIEQPLMSNIYYFAGTPDRKPILVNNKLTLIDIKITTSMQLSTGIQLAAYQILYEENYKKK